MHHRRTRPGCPWCGILPAAVVLVSAVRPALSSAAEPLTKRGKACAAWKAWSARGAEKATCITAMTAKRPRPRQEHQVLGTLREVVPNTSVVMLVGAVRSAAPRPEYRMHLPRAHDPRALQDQCRPDTELRRWRRQIRRSRRNLPGLDRGDDCVLHELGRCRASDAPCISPLFSWTENRLSICLPARHANVMLAQGNRRHASLLVICIDATRSAQSFRLAHQPQGMLSALIATFQLP